MTQLFIFLAQSVTGAVATIVALLLVAVLIGYFTAWFYAKSVYTPVIKKLEADKTELNSKIAVMKSEISDLNTKAGILTEKIGKLEEDIAEKDKEIKKLTKSKK